MHKRATKHFQYGLLLSTPKGKKRKENYLHGKAPNKKKNEKSFWVFILIPTTGKEIKLTIFFGFSQGLSNTQEEN